MDLTNGQAAFSFASGDVKRCNQCWQIKPASEFVSPKTGKATSANCSQCLARYRQGVADHRTGLRTEGDDPRVFFNLKSHNRKTGPIPVSLTSPETCPPSCPLFNAGCYAEDHMLRTHWRRVASRGMSWDQFCSRVASLPSGQIWRHNEAGDLPGVGEDLDERLLDQLVEANMGKRGFTYTHKRTNVEAIRRALERGFAVNMSADSLDEAKRFAGLRLPVVVVLGRIAPKQIGSVRLCPATYSDVTCEKCGLCAKIDRKFAIGFPAHGSGRVLITKRFARAGGYSDGSSGWY